MSTDSPEFLYNVPSDYSSQIEKEAEIGIGTIANSEAGLHFFELERINSKRDAVTLVDTSFHRNDSGSDSGEPTSPATAALLDPELELELEEEQGASCLPSSSYNIKPDSYSIDEQRRWQSKYLTEEVVEYPPTFNTTVLFSEQNEKLYSHKLHFDPKLSQQKRRKLTLEWQKRRRDHILDKIRQLEGDSGVSDSETDDGLDFLQGRREPMKKLYENKNKGTSKKNKQKRNRNRGAPARVMLSEWLIQKPDDFEDEWIGVLCPVGKRTIVVASRGKTKVYSRREENLGSFISSLPGGRKVAGNRGRGVTILDCIYSEVTKVFYVLDLICWNSHSCINCNTECRQFFLASKFSENQDLMVASTFNHIPFMPLPYFLGENLQTIMTSVYPPFPDPIDGVLFVHKEAFYISEINPLCLWILISDIGLRFGIDVNPDLLSKEIPLSERKNWKHNMDFDTITKPEEEEVQENNNE